MPEQPTTPLSLPPLERYVTLRTLLIVALATAIVAAAAGVALSAAVLAPAVVLPGRPASR
jgi:hypothetical protein